MNNLQLVKSENFGSVKCDFYKNEINEILMTREQIGAALQYSDPMVAIGKIHNRHEERINKFSFTSLVNGRETYFYTAKGVYEVCRWSQQTKANDFMDWVWDIVEGLRKGEVSLVPTNAIAAVRMVNKQVDMLLGTVEELDNKIASVDKKVETQITLTFNQAKNIQFKISERVIVLLGGKGSEDYRQYKSRYFSAIHRDVKKRLGVPSYRDILKKDYSTALSYIENWIPEADIKEVC